MEEKLEDKLLTLELLDELVDIAKKDNEKWIEEMENNPKFAENMKKLATK